jgi:hypothetical protein
MCERLKKILTKVKKTKDIIAFYNVSVEGKKIISKENYRNEYQYVLQVKNTKKNGRLRKQYILMNFNSFLKKLYSNWTSTGRQEYYGCIFFATYESKIYGCSRSNKIVVVKGKAIHESYAGFGNSNGLYSCMSGGRSNCTKLYSNNPKVCSLVKLMINGVPRARALLWKVGNGKYYLDRIYAGDSIGLTRRMQEWAEKKGYLVRGHTGERFILKLSLINDKGERIINRYPYADSFCSAQLIMNGDNLTHLIVSSGGQRFITENSDKVRALLKPGESLGKRILLDSTGGSYSNYYG